MKTIELKLNKSITSLCGNPYGKQIFIEQVGPNMDSDELIEVHIPDFIDSVSMSFAQGFISILAEQYGLEKVSEHIQVTSARSRIQQKFEDAISFRSLL